MFISPWGICLRSHEININKKIALIFASANMYVIKQQFRSFAVNDDVSDTIPFPVNRYVYTTSLCNVWIKYGKHT